MLLILKRIVIVVACILALAYAMTGIVVIGFFIAVNAPRLIGGENATIFVTVFFLSSFTIGIQWAFEGGEDGPIVRVLRRIW